VATGVTQKQVLHVPLVIAPDDRTFAVPAWPTDGPHVVVGRFGDPHVRSLTLPRGVLDPADAVAFSPDMRTLVATESSHVFEWNLRTGRRTRLPITMPSAELSGIAFSPDGKTLAIGTSGAETEETIVLWRLDHAKPRRRSLPSVRFGISSLAFSPDGSVIAAGTSDKVMLWDVESRKPLGQPLDNGVGTSDIAFSPDGSTLASAAGNPWWSVITLWSVGVSAWQRLVCALVGRSLSKSEWTQYLQDRPYHATCGGGRAG
jgi:WD40 repeat protein